MSRKIIVQLETITDNYTTAALVDLANVLVQDKWLLVFIKTIRTRTEPGKAIFQIEVAQKLHVLTLQKLHRSANLPADLFNLLHGQMEQIAAADTVFFRQRAVLAELRDQICRRLIHPCAGIQFTNTRNAFCQCFADHCCRNRQRFDDDGKIANELHI